MPYVEIIRSGRKLRDVAVEGFEATVGRDPKSEIALDGDSVSRRHARLFTKDGAWMIEDLGTRNGTFVNGAREYACMLHDGDRIQIFEWVLVFHSPPGEAVPAAPPRFVSRRDFERAEAAAKGVRWEPLQPTTRTELPTVVTRLDDVISRAHDVEEPEGTRIEDPRRSARARREALARMGPHLEREGELPIPLQRDRVLVGGQGSSADVRLPGVRSSGTVLFERVNGEWEVSWRGFFGSVRVNGKKKRRARLEGNETLELLGVQLVFRDERA